MIPQDVRFGLALDFGTERASLDRVLDEYAPVLELAERYGFHSVWAGENYPRRPGSFHLPSPLLVLAALAPRTRLGLGTGATLAPLWNPLKLAYDGALLDQLSGGRFIMGVGLGNPLDWARFGVDRRTISRRMDETLQALKALWSGSDGFEGEIVSIRGGIAPLPVQPGGPPLWVGGLNERAARRAALFGDGWYAATSYPLPAIAEQVDRYRAELAKADKQADRPIVAVNRLTFLAQSDAEARRQGGEYVEATLQKYAAMFDPAQVRGADAGVTHLRGQSGSLLDAVGRDVCLVGGPDTVRTTVQRYVDAGVTDFELRVAPSDMPIPLVVQTVTLFGEQVIPSFR